MLTNINGIIILFDAYYDFKTDQMHLVFCFHKTLLLIPPPFALGTEKLKMSLEFGKHVFLSRLPLILWCHLRMNTLLGHRVHPSLFDQGEHLPLNVLWRGCTPGTVVGHAFSPPTPAQLSIVPSRVCFSFYLQVFRGQGISEKDFKPCISVFMRMEFNTMSRENEDFKWLPKNGRILYFLL